MGHTRAFETLFVPVEEAPLARRTNDRRSSPPASCRCGSVVATHFVASCTSPTVAPAQANRCK
jgi:hypothetical protein